MTDVVVVATPTDEAGNTAGGFGRAHWLGLAGVRDGQVKDWRVVEVGWDVAHDQGTHGAHHARVVRFLKENNVSVVVIDHIGEGMYRMLTTMDIAMLPAQPGDAQASILAAIASATQDVDAVHPQDHQH